MRIISLRTLKDYYEKHPETETALKVWKKKVENAEWEKPSDILQSFTHARPIKNGRVIFNINKNDYRLIVAVNYKSGQVYITFLDTHEEYNKIDPETVWNY